MTEYENMTSNSKDESFLNNQLNVDQVASKLRWALRNYWWDEKIQDYTNVVAWQHIDSGLIVTIEPKAQEKESYISVHAEPKLNEDGINAVISEVTSRLSNAYGSANLSNEDLRSTRMATAEALWDILHHNRKKFEMKVENMKSILFIVDDQILLFLSRSVEGTFSKLLSKLTGMRESYNYNLTGTPKDLPQEKKTRGGLF
jgi:hypothetical protein